MLKADIKSELIQAQRDYLDEVMRQTGLTLTEIAVRANAHHSTLTRFRNRPDHKGALAPTTINMIAERTGVPAPDSAGGYPPSRSAMARALAARPAGLSDNEAEPYDATSPGASESIVAAAIRGRLHVVLWRLQSRALEDEGYMPGDILLVDLNAQPRAGDIVCAQIYDLRRQNGTRTVFRLYHPPYLVGAGREEGARKPHLVDGNTVVVKGVVEASFRLRT